MSKKRILFISLVHFGILVILFIISFSAGMDEFDGKREITEFERLSGIITEILMSPVGLLWNSWASKNIHDVIENILFIANSFIWGVSIEYLYSKFWFRTKNT